MKLRPRSAMKCRCNDNLNASLLCGGSGDLGSIDKQYDVAASTASGALDYIVVEDTPTAQRCVELLRSRGLGVATFLILDKQKHLEQRAMEKLQPPEGIYTALAWTSVGGSPHTHRQRAGHILVPIHISNNAV